MSDSRPEIIEMTLGEAYGLVAARMKAFKEEHREEILKQIKIKEAEKAAKQAAEKAKKGEERGKKN